MDFLCGDGARVVDGGDEGAVLDFVMEGGDVLQWIDFLGRPAERIV